MISALAIPLAKYLLATLVVAAGAIAACALLRFEKLIDQALAALVIAISQVIISLLVSGAILRMLEPKVVLAVNIVISAVLIGAAALTHRLPYPRAVGELAVRTRAALREALTDPFAAALAGVAVVVTMWLAFLATALPPYDFDGLFYHLTTVATWLQQKQIGFTNLEIWSNVYPADTELIFTWQSVFLQNGLLIHNAEVLFAIVGALAVAGIARHFAFSRAHAVAAASLYLLSPVVMAQEPTAYVDLAFASMFLACFYFVLRYIRAWRLQELAIAGLAGGFVCGSKSSSVVFLAVAFALIPIAAILRLRAARASRGHPIRSAVDMRLPAHQRLAVNPAIDIEMLSTAPMKSVIDTDHSRAVEERSPRPLVAYAPPAQAYAPPERSAASNVWNLAWSSARTGVSVLLVLGAPIAVMGLFWYLRTWIAYGNPVYPFTVSFHGTIIFPGTGDVSDLIMKPLSPKEIYGLPWWQQVAISWSHLLPVGNESDHGFFIYDQRLGSFGPQWLLAEFPALVALIGYTAVAKVNRQILGYLIVPFTIIFLLQPAPWWGRYVAFYVALGAIALPFALDKLPKYPIRSVAKVAALGLVFLGAYLTVTQGGYFNMSALNMALTMPLESRTVGQVWLKSYAWVDAVPEGSTIAASTDVQYNYYLYPLFGSHFKNHVVLLTANDASGFLSQLEADHVQYVFTEAGTREDHWISQYPSRFQLIDSMNGFNRVYIVQSFAGG